MMNIYQSGLNSWLIGGTTLDPLITAWIARMTALGYTTPSVTIQNALSTFINTPLSSGTIKSRMKTGYILHAGSKEAATLNIVNPLTYQTILVNSPTFLEGSGMKSNGTTSYINQPFKSNEYAGIESDLTTIQYISESSVSAGDVVSCGFRTTAGGLYTRLYPLRTLGVSAGHYGNLQAALFSNTNHKALLVLTHNGTTGSIYRDGVKKTWSETATAPVLSQNRLILALNNDAGSSVTPAQFYAFYVACDFLFNRFNDADELAFRTAFNTYKTEVGLL